MRRFDEEVEMWTYEHSVQTSASPERIWSLWADVARWPAWNDDIERIELIGPFAAGSTILMTPIGGEPIELRVAEAVEPERFVDEARLGELVVRTIHRVRPVSPAAAEVTYRTEITGPDADTLGAEIGAAITEDFPQTLAQLAARAET
jgi:Polyketide cyclase / dehydrase and lipid transport